MMVYFFPITNFDSEIVYAIFVKQYFVCRDLTESQHWRAYGVSGPLSRYSVLLRITCHQSLPFFSLNIRLWLRARISSKCNRANISPLDTGENTCKLSFTKITLALSFHAGGQAFLSQNLVSLIRLFSRIHYPIKTYARQSTIYGAEWWAYTHFTRLWINRINK